jgi:hypothetical protein
VRCAMAATDFVLGRGAPASMITRLALRIIGRSLGWPARRLVVADRGAQLRSSSGLSGGMCRTF